MSVLMSHDCVDTLHIDNTNAPDDQHKLGLYAMSEIVKQEGLSSSTDSVETWDQIMRWYDQTSVKQGHARTQGPDQRPRVLPDRLIDVGDDRLGNDVRLIDKLENCEHIEYITLSHRWPQSGFDCRLIISSYVQMCERIPISDLSLKFQHAIRICRRLRVKYLWIDVLCIIQDSREDWDVQSKMMGDIYRNATLNIAMDDSKNRSAGILQQRTNSLFIPQKVNITWGFETKAPRHIYRTYEPIRGDFWVVEAKYRENTTLSTDISGRAWVFQERLLSPRILLFSQDQVSWESNFLSACEVFPIGYPHRESGGYNPNPLSHIDLMDHFGKGYFGGSRHGEERLLPMWDRLVEQYSTCDLTHTSDHLKAIAGLASVFEDLLPDEEYYFGVWRSQFPRCLLWTASRAGKMDDSGCRKIVEKGIPSWSWASVMGQVEMVCSLNTEGMDRHGDLLADCIPTSEIEGSESDLLLDMDGDMGHLAMRGRLLPLSISRFWSFGHLWVSDVIPTCHSWIPLIWVNWIAMIEIDDRSTLMTRYGYKVCGRQIYVNISLWVLPFVIFTIACRGTWVAYLCNLFSVILSLACFPHYAVFRRPDDLYLLAIKTSYEGTQGLVLCKDGGRRYTRIGFFKQKEWQYEKYRDSLSEEQNIILV